MRSTLDIAWPLTARPAVVACAAIAVVLGVGAVGAQQPATAPEAGSAAPSTSRSAAGPAVMLVFDNSGSMWGRIDGTSDNKLKIATAAVDNALATIPPSARIGLLTAGRRGGNSCSDIEITNPLEPGSREAIRTTLENQNPKGRGPIVEMTRRAATALGDQRPASIIILHDDADNCQQNACEAAAELAKSHPGLKIFPISLAMKREDVAAVACLATATGGRHFDTQIADDVPAAVETALRLATQTGARRRPDAAKPATIGALNVPQPVAASRPLVPLTGPPGLRMTAHLTEGADPLAIPIAWRVTKAGASDGDAIFETMAPDARVDLAPGSYTVHAKVGLVTASQSFVVSATAPVRAAITLQAGALQFLTRAQRGGPAIDSVTYTVNKAADGEKPGASTAATGEMLWLGRDPKAPLVLPPGRYRVLAERGFARAEQIITVPAGGTGAVDLALGAGLLTLRATAEDGGTPLATALFVVSEDDPEAPKGQREVVRSAAVAPDFVLPAGTYNIVVRIGSAEVREQIALGAGESVNRTVLIGMGRLELTANVDAPRATAGVRDSISFQVIALDGGAQEIGRYSTAPQSIELPVGTYRIDAQIGAQNVREVQQVRLAAGRPTRVAFDMKAARVTLKIAADTSATGVSDVLWEVRDARGAMVWRTGQIEPRIIVRPGRYTVRASLRGRDLAGTFEVNAGEAQTVTVGP